MRRERLGLLMGLLLGSACTTSTTSSGQFTLSGVVQGLNGTLVLHTGTENLVVSADGPFKFVSTFATNASYVVSLLTQPDSQTCTVKNGVGVFGTQSVTGVQVTCADLTGSSTGGTTGSTGGATGGSSTGGTTGPRADGFAVGGAVHGLKSSLVLQSSSQLSIDTVTLLTNGTANLPFAFPTREPFGADYSVSIVQQPYNQLCTIQGGDGTVSTADVTSIQVYCTYTVGGQAQGLSSAAVFQNTANDGSAPAKATVYADGSFTFPALYDANTTYSVSVATQPSGQTCTVVNGTGVVGNANVNNVAINCPPGFYSVGGNVDISGSSVILQLNGSNTALSSGGAFTFTQYVQATTPYSVTVKKQPSTQRCTVRQSSTIMPARLVNDVSVSCGAVFGAYALGGIITGVNNGSYVSLANGSDTQVGGNGAYSMPQPVSGGSSYSIGITQNPPYQRCSIVNATGIMPNGPVSNANVACVPYLSFDTAQQANVVIGQFDFNSTTPQATNSNTLAGPTGGAAMDNNGRVYISDTANSRVLVYNQLPTHNNARADFALGQPALNGNQPSVGNSNFNLPGAVSTDGTRVVVSDTGNNRVLLYPAGYDGTGISTSPLVIGQPGLGVNSAACSGTGLNQPVRAKFVGNRLVIADTGNNRVLIWNNAPTNSTTPPNFILGQTSATTCQVNQGSSSPSSNTLWGPQGIYSDGTALYIADTKNNRVMVWSSIGSITGNNQAATWVLGQGSFTTNPAGCAPAAMGRPVSLGTDGTQLYVADSNNSRILLFDTTNLSSGQSASAVLGQQDLNSCNCNQTGSNVLCRPEGVSVLGTQLLVSDTGNNRVLVFNGH